ncbi:MAG: DUF4259 domain-containing protein [Corynebacterium sp.]|nr:DUF4259 domain-containing protein [Corynebacterium sp.]
MTTWDIHIFNADENQDFLDDLANFYEDENYEDLVDTLVDICTLADSNGYANADEAANAACAATIAAIWAGAPFSAAEAVEDYPFIKGVGESPSDELIEHAGTVLEHVAEEEENYDLDVFLEALS